MRVKKYMTRKSAHAFFTRMVIFRLLPNFALEKNGVFFVRTFFFEILIKYAHRLNPVKKVVHVYFSSHFQKKTCAVFRKKEPFLSESASFAEIFNLSTTTYFVGTLCHLNKRRS